MSKTACEAERVVNGIVSIAQLIDHPRLARLYTYVLRKGTVTIDQIVADLELPRTTAYADAGTLVDLALLTQDDSRKTHTYTATPIRLTAIIDGAEYTITPTLIEAIGRIPTDRDLELLVEKYGVGKLAAALTYTIPYVEGGMTERVAARELDLQIAFGIAVLQALRDAILTMRDDDPYLGQIRNAHERSINEEGEQLDHK